MNLEFPYLYFKIWIECSYLHDSFVHYFLASEYRWKRSPQMLPSLLTHRLWMFRSSHQPRAFVRRGEGGCPPSPWRTKALGKRLWIAKNREWKLNNLTSVIHYSWGASSNYSLFFLSSSCLFIIHNDKSLKGTVLFIISLTWLCYALFEFLIFQTQILIVHF